MKKREREARRLAGIRRYRNDIRAIRRATGASYQEARRLVPPSVRRPGGKRATRAEQVYAAKERLALQEEARAAAPGGWGGAGMGEPTEPTGGPPAGTQVELTYLDLMEQLHGAARMGHDVAFSTPFFELAPETIDPLRASEIYREFGQAGDRNDPKDKSRYWRMRALFRLTFTRSGFLVEGPVGEAGGAEEKKESA